MKIWIVNESQLGNGQKLSETLQKGIGKNAEVNISHIDNVSVDKVVADAPDMLIVIIAVRMFQLSFKMKKWLRALKGKLKKENKTIKSTAVYVTHILKVDTVNFWGKRILKMQQKGDAFTKVYPEWISAQVADAKGPFVEGKIEELEKNIKDILKWAKS
ncbi:MAG: hypothetical protein ACTSQN_14075 [Candidatus Heimdallarchaeota archaeon]